MTRHRSTSKKPPPEIGLHMECIEEDLESCQVDYYTKADKEYTEIQNKLDSYIKKLKAEVIEKSENCCVLQISDGPSLGFHQTTLLPSSTGKCTRQSAQSNQQNYHQILEQGITTRSTGNSSRSAFVVMDAGGGFVVGQMSPSNIAQEQSGAQIVPKSLSVGRSRQSTVSGQGAVTITRGKGSSKKHTSNVVETDVLTPPATRTREKYKNSSQNLVSDTQDPQVVYATSQSTPTSVGCYGIQLDANQVPSSLKPTENTAVGGLTAGTKTSWKSSTEIPNANKGSADSKEVAFSKVAGKTFPSLVVVARPYLKTKFMQQSKVSQERAALDAKVKGVLVYTATKFTEWLIQQGLIKSEQICQAHINNDSSGVRLKLGMYSDVSQFPFSGGYVWISDCCPSQFVSVFSGSIFEGAPHPPSTLLKLIYHWACQTNVQNIVQWVKVDNLYIKNFFTQMRAVCTQAIHEKLKKMGGPKKKIEVGVISLGTTSQDGNKRQVKVEVLGVMDFENKLIRLRAVEPYSDEKNLKRRFIRILQPLEEWVSKDSTILTDFTVNKAALNSMGFHTVLQVTSDVRYSNGNVMEYLRRIVPRMFQNTLSLLSKQIIQQFLDELVWREVWGPLPSQAFANVIVHLAEQTKLNAQDNILTRLGKVASNPFDDWSYSVWNSASDRKKVLVSPEMSSVETNFRDPVLVTQTDNNRNTDKGTRSRKRAAEQPVVNISVSPLPNKKPARLPAKDKYKKDEKIKNSEKTLKTENEAEKEIIKFIEGGQQIPLDTFYYGLRKEPENTENGNVKNNLSVGLPFKVKCCVCNKRFTDNIVLMKHMILHCQTEPELTINIKNIQQCNNCFLGFNTRTELNDHLGEVHFVDNNKSENNFWCHICEFKFSSRILLVYHMQKTHVEKEMPYECGICFLRTSVYRLFVEHFIQFHRGEEQIFCPYCLKVVSVSYKGAEITQNVLFYMSHLEKHQRLNLVKDCDRCQLSFIHGGIWDQHLEADHHSWGNADGVEPLPEIYTGILMPEPGQLLKPLPVVNLLIKSPKSKSYCTENKCKTLKIVGLEENMTCLECEEFLFRSQHFTTGNFTCLKCRYSTWCERAMAEHVDIFHESPILRFTLGKPLVLPQEMFCPCGYSSTAGNRIAKHLAICERKTAYSSLESAMAAAPETSMPDMTVPETTKGEGQNVLNMLGLVRKSPETSLPEGGEEEKEVEDGLESKNTCRGVEATEKSDQDEGGDFSEKELEIAGQQVENDNVIVEEAEAEDLNDKDQVQDIHILDTAENEREPTPDKTSAAADIRDVDAVIEPVGNAELSSVQLKSGSDQVDDSILNEDLTDAATIDEESTSLKTDKDSKKVDEDAKLESKENKAIVEEEKKDEEGERDNKENAVERKEHSTISNTTL